MTETLVERLRQYEGRDWETTVCYNGLRDEAANEITALRALADEMGEALEELSAKSTDPQYDYERNGAQWTGGDGREYVDQSYMLAWATELGEIARATFAKFRAHQEKNDG